MTCRVRLSRSGVRSARRAVLAAMVGGRTLTELRQSFATAESEIEGGLSPRVAPFADIRISGPSAAVPALRCRSPISTCDRALCEPIALLARSAAHGCHNPLVERRRQRCACTLIRLLEVYASRFSDTDGASGHLRDRVAFRLGAA